MTCTDCHTELTAANAFHPYGDKNIPATRCTDCNAAAWERLAAQAATQRPHPANTISNVWD